MRVKVSLVVSLALIFAAWSAAPALAVIEALLKLGNVINDSDAIYMTRVEKVDAEKGQLVLTASTALQGKPAGEKLMVSLKAGKADDVGPLLKRIAVEVPLLLFETDLGGGKRQILAFTNGTWFQLSKSGEGPWGFVGSEPYLRRTFKGTTAELKAVVEGVVSGKLKAPAPNGKEPPGLGPEIATAPVASTGRLPAYYAEVVDEAERQKVYDIQAAFESKIDRIEAELEAMKAERDEKIMKVLSPEKLRRIEALRAAAAAKRAEKNEKKAEAKP